MSVGTRLTTLKDIWFHRYENGRDIEGRFDYNSWIESDKGRRLANSLDKNVVLAEGYKEYDTGRTYMAKMGDWRRNKDEEIELDGVGGVNILVKADVHRSGECSHGKKIQPLVVDWCTDTMFHLSRHQFPMLCIRKSGRNRRLCENGEACGLPGLWIAKLRCLGK
jgi:hypothetical protein